MRTIRSSSRNKALLLGASIMALSLPWHMAHADTQDEIAELKKLLRAQEATTRALEHRLDALTANQKTTQLATQHQLQLVIEQAKTADRQASATPLTAVTRTPAPPQDYDAGYKNGYYIKDPSGDNELFINGLLQPRYRFFQPNGTTKFGAKDQASNNFDIFLARLYFSGNIVDPSLTYFFTLQGTTQGGETAPGITLLDAELAKTFNPYLKIEMGRYWSAYTYEYYLDIGKYMFPDLSAAEWAFALGRQVGVRASGKVGDFTYNLSVSNPIPGSTSGATENDTTKLAVVGNVMWDILAPYGYQETDPTAKPVYKPELSLWLSAMYNPVENGSVTYNDVKGDNTEGATGSLNFRDGIFAFQASAYYKHNDARGPYDGNPAHPSFNSTGWQEQAGVYLIPGVLEAAERVDGITWGYRQTGPAEAAPDSSDTQWYAGPDNFGYRHITEYTADLNYYLRGHRAKAQLAYSYIRGSNFSNETFGANRVVLQTQLAF
jgi:hypothetical protein